MKQNAEDQGVTDLTDLTEETAEEASDSELFAHLARREPRNASGLHLVPQAREGRAQLAQLGALLPSTIGRPSIPAPPARPGPGAAVSPPSAPRSSTPAPASSALPVTTAFDDDDALTPARQALPARRTGAAQRKRVVVVASVVGAALLTVLAVLAVVSARGGETGALMVTVAGPGSRAVTGFEVLVDGEKRCVESPCRISAMKAGTHLVGVRGRAFEPTASLAVAVEPRAESVLNVVVSPVAKPARAAVVEAATETPKDRLAAAPVAPATTSLGTRAAAARPVATPAPPSVASAAPNAEAMFGTLRIASIPVAGVLIDGRPVGPTPRVVRVAPGTHRVAIVVGEQRRAQTVTVAPGATQVVSVKF